MVTVPRGTSCLPVTLSMASRRVGKQSPDLLRASPATSSCCQLTTSSKLVGPSRNTSNVKRRKRVNVATSPGVSSSTSSTINNSSSIESRPDFKSTTTLAEFFIEDLLHTSSAVEENDLLSTKDNDTVANSSPAVSGQELVPYQGPPMQNDTRFNNESVFANVRQHRYPLPSGRNQLNLNFILLVLTLVLLYIIICCLYWKIWKLETTNRHLISSLHYSNSELENTERKYFDIVKGTKRINKKLNEEISELKKRITSLFADQQKMLKEISITSERDNKIIKQLVIKMRQLRSVSLKDTNLINYLKRKDEEMKTNFRILEKESNQFLLNNTLLNEKINSHVNMNKVLIERNNKLKKQMQKMESGRDYLKRQLHQSTIEKSEILQKTKELERLMENEQKKFATVKKNLKNISQLKTIQITSLMNRPKRKRERKIKHKRRSN